VDVEQGLCCAEVEFVDALIVEQDFNDLPRPLPPNVPERVLDALAW
jgi:hypothetical protein